MSQSLQGTSAEKLSVKFISEQTMTMTPLSLSLNGSRVMSDQDVSIPEPMEQDHQDYVNTTAIFQPAAYTPLPRDLSSRKRRRALGSSEDTSKSDRSSVAGSDAPPEDEYYRASQDDEAKASKDVVHWVDTEGREKKRAFMAALGYKNTATLFAHPTDQPAGSRSHDGKY
jgi:hypothetical protein